jgi:hypothetical protein
MHLPPGLVRLTRGTHQTPRREALNLVPPRQVVRDCGVSFRILMSLASVAMSAWNELVERAHDLQNLTSVDKIRLAGAVSRTPPPTQSLWELSRKCEPGLVLALGFHRRIHVVVIEVASPEADRLERGACVDGAKGRYLFGRGSSTITGCSSRARAVGFG